MLQFYVQRFSKILYEHGQDPRSNRYLKQTLEVPLSFFSCAMYMKLYISWNGFICPHICGWQGYLPFLNLSIFTSLLELLQQTSSRSSGGKSSTPKIAQWHSDVHPSTSKGSPLKLKLVSEESSGLSDDNDSDSEMNESDEDDDSGINETDSDGEPRLKMAIDSENEKLDISEQSKKGEKRSAGSSPDSKQ